MNVGISTHDGIYQVEAYYMARGEKWSKWHTLRQFQVQGEAIMFRDWIDTKDIDMIEQYAKSFNKQRVVEHVKFKHWDRQPVLVLRQL